MADLKVTPREEAAHLLAEAKAEQPGVAAMAPLLGPGGYDLVMLIGAWHGVRVDFRSTNTRPPADPWSRLWGFYEIRIADVARVLGTHTGAARAVVERAVQMRLVYPDGTTPDLAQTTATDLFKARLP